uniref:molybdopterin biosynthesis protein n=1 Tax=Campylaephora boydenii TaxID=202204 RepID=UPI002551DEC2|nr:molybdopterin biosynthesis protein [Campylaephora boydenii]WGT74065.1 molybdopterin biosynthesis protein [Campylaephora boydenii]
MLKNTHISLSLNTREYQQYSKQIILENIGINGQKRLKNAKILIIGLGGLGCPAFIYLATSGIGNIGIIDNDIINLSNLNRQILYNINQINNNKIDAASYLVQQINKECDIHLYTEKLNQLNGYKIIKKYDIIIDATDNFKTRYIIDDICYKLHKIHIYGAIHKYEGHMSVFNYKNNLRYIDLYPKILNLQELNCEDNGILGVMSGIIGILQATEAIKIILGIGKILNGKILKYNLLTTSFNQIRLHPAKKRYQTIIYKNDINKKDNIINLKDINHINNINDCQPLLIDIRNPTEFQLFHIYKTINIPRKYFQAKKTIEFIKLSCKMYIIILTCNKLMTSSSIANLLNHYNIQTYILKQVE